MNTITDSRLVFSTYSEYTTFLKNIGGNEVGDLNTGLYEALINIDCTPKEARNFLAEDLDIRKITEVRLYSEKVVFQFDEVEFSEVEYSENNIAGFTIAFYFEEQKWQWIEMF